jgi:hypothetical protein
LYQRLLPAAALLALTSAFAAFAAPQRQAPAQAAPGAAADGLFGAPPSARLRYDTEYPVIGYSGVPTHNAIARLQARLDRGELTLAFHPVRGYLDSLLKALAIDPSSQSLVYSRTSLQVGSIRAATPRAIYFNEDTYVAWVQGSEVLELGAMDDALGQVFYTLQNRAEAGVRFQRETDRCLSCHDTYELSGGGVPRFLLMSSYVDTRGEQLTHEGSIITTDETPLESRWGGWYVTGRHGSQVHLGNIQVHRVEELEHLENVRRGNLDVLDGLFDTRPYLTDKSDIVALLILQHQVTVQNLLTRANFEVRTALAAGHGTADGEVLQKFLEPLLDAMLFVDAADISRIGGNSGFDKWFEAQGPKDARGRSLRDLDLTTRIFKYPFSYLVYSSAFDALPDAAREYLYKRLDAILSGRDASAKYAGLTAADRRAVLEILSATDPAFARSAGLTNRR